MNVNIEKVETNSNGELTILTGEYKHKEEARGCQISGDAGTIVSYLNVYDCREGYAIVGSNKIVLHTDKSFPGKSDQITSNYKLSPDVEQFGINDINKSFTVKQLIRLVKSNAHLFKMSKQGVKELVAGLQNFSIKWETELEKRDDRKGNSGLSTSITMQIKQGLVPESVTLSLPVIGRDSIEIEVDIEIDKSPNDEPVFSFTCLQLSDIINKKRDELMQFEVNRLYDKKIPVIFNL